MTVKAIRSTHFYLMNKTQRFQRQNSGKINSLAKLGDRRDIREMLIFKVLFIVLSKRVQLSLTSCLKKNKMLKCLLSKKSALSLLSVS